MKNPEGFLKRIGEIPFRVVGWWSLDRLQGFVHGGEKCVLGVDLGTDLTANRAVGEVDDEIRLFTGLALEGAFGTDCTSELDDVSDIAGGLERSADDDTRAFELAGITFAHVLEHDRSVHISKGE